MVSLKNLLVVLAVSASSFAIPFSSREDGQFKASIYQKLPAPPAGWERDDSVKLDKDSFMVKLRIHLVQQGMKKFHDLAMKIATPGHELYGGHLAQHVIDSMIAPKQESKDLVLEWLDTEGLRSHAEVSPRSDSIIVEASLEQIEKLLKAEYSKFVRPESGDSAVRTLEYSLPDILKGHVDMVQPTTFFGLRAMKSTIKEVTMNIEDNIAANKINTAASPAAVKGCNSNSITPICLANLYNFASDTTNQTVGRMGIAGFLEQHPIQSDLKTFMNKYAYFDNKNETYSCELINGGTCPATDVTNNIVEANLDVQYARAITQNIPNVYYSTGGRPPWLGSGGNTNEPYLEFLNYLLALDDDSLPNTMSISYGDDEATVPIDYANTCCDLFAQLGARGVSILVASGDSGVGNSCKVDGKAQFTTAFPAACPWVTTVGGTTGTSPEGTWSDGGGGFSEIFGRPSYQNDTVNTWLETDTTHTAISKYFNSSGRAYPDVSAQAMNFLVVLLGSAAGVSGTSAACPTFASVVQLLNSDRLASGKKPLGFLNPWLYGEGAKGMNDITTGRITGCSGSISGAGFSAVAGWDPATGLGSPNYGSLLAISRATA
ncbi:Subtilisin-like protein [Venustampulla echinocandica]|uniref:tripeptidyl-peptidase II n=1 Tax=Venustampulla echinocandica TaxID=2656787 RepID=A0A370U1M0_9HELO|nr:Subtilisin-like protein [Venustampulla echinocandica]RDL41680.1 Subtilisin-like protein [Venustampulla echinocandica]